MSSSVIAVIGVGHMGSSLISGLIAHGQAPETIWACDIDPQQLMKTHKDYGVHVSEDNEEALKYADIVILAVKPQHLAQTVKPLTLAFSKKKPLVISVVAGVRVMSLRNLLGDVPIVRAMPNMPALIRAGTTALYADNIAEKLRDEAYTIMTAVGVVIWVETEELLDVVTGLSGSGPAYFFLMMDILAKAAVELGLSDDTARFLILHTGLGAIKMAIESGQPLATLTKQVASPGGITERALKVLLEGDVETLLKQALYTAKERAKELALEFGVEK